MSNSISGMPNVLPFNHVRLTDRREQGGRDGDSPLMSGPSDLPGGGLGKDLVEALQRLGVKLPPSTAGTAPTAEGKGGGQVDNHLRKFMQALSEAMKGERGGVVSGSDANSASVSGEAVKVKVGDRSALDSVLYAGQVESSWRPESSSPEKSSDIGTGLSSLISQVSKGSAPESLQTAFDDLMKGLSPGGGKGEKGSISLQQLLDQLQQYVGYGKSSQVAASGNLLNTHA